MSFTGVHGNNLAAAAGTTDGFADFLLLAGAYAGLFPMYNVGSIPEFRANSKCKGLEPSAGRHLSNGLDMVFFYTWAHKNHNAAVFRWHRQDAINLRGDSGRAVFNLRPTASTSPARYLLSPSSSPNNRRRSVAGIWQANGSPRRFAELPPTLKLSTAPLSGSGFLWADAGAFRGGAGTPFRVEEFISGNRPRFKNPGLATGNRRKGVIDSAGAPPSFRRNSRQSQLAVKVTT